MITGLKLKNFRTFVESDIKLRRLNCIVGPNMSGKSNLLDAFRFLRDVVSQQPGASGLNFALTKRQGFSEVANKAETNPRVEFHVDGLLISDVDTEWDYHLEIVGDLRSGYAAVEREMLQVGGVPLIETSSGNVVLRGNSGKVLFQTGIDPSRLGISYDLPDWYGTVVRTQLLRTVFYQLSPVAMKTISPMTATAALEEDGSNLAPWLLTMQTRHLDEFTQLAKACADALPALKSLFTNPTQQATVYLSSAERGMLRPTTQFGMSSGELCFIALLSLILSPAELSSPLYCVEEPENHLHPRLVSILIGVYRQLAQEAERSQVILTTHSPFVLDEMKIEEILYCGREGNRTMVSRPGDKDELRELVKSSELGISDLYFSGALTNA